MSKEKIPSGQAQNVYARLAGGAGGGDQKTLYSSFAGCESQFFEKGRGGDGPRVVHATSASKRTAPPTRILRKGILLRGTGKNRNESKNNFSFRG